MIMNKFLLLFAGIVLSYGAVAKDVKNYEGRYSEVVGAISFIGDNGRCDYNDSASAVIVNHDNYHRVYTAAHVIIDGDTNLSRTKNGYCLNFKGVNYKGRYKEDWYCDVDRDICYAEFKGRKMFMDRDIVFTEVGNFVGNYGVGDELSVAGIAWDDKYVEFNSFVDFEKKYYFVSPGDECDINKRTIVGMSGGGIFDGNKVVGINVLTSSLIPDIRTDFYFERIKIGVKYKVNYGIVDDGEEYEKIGKCRYIFAGKDQRLAKRGDDAAQFLLGMAYYNGEGVAQDYKESFKWFKRSSRQGNEFAENAVGVMYENGEGVKENFIEAIKWYRKSAKQDFDVAQHNLGEIYYKGEGVKKDYNKAIKWYRKSAEKGNVYSQFRLGYMYFEGEGVAQDYEIAFSWYKKSAVQGEAASQYNLGLMYYNGEGTEKDLDDAFKWTLLSAEQGYANAQYNIGYMYDNGDGVPENDREAVKWYKLAAEQGHAKSQNTLASMYDIGEGIKQDHAKARYWYIKAAVANNIYAQYNLCYNYLYGEFVDYKLSHKYCVDALANETLNDEFNFNNIKDLKEWRDESLEMLKIEKGEV